MTVTITKNLPYTEYEKLPGLRASDMKTLLKSPKAYYNAKTLGIKKDASKSMNLGSAAHTAILEPEKFADEIVVFDGAVRRGKEWDKFKAEHEGKLILNANEFDSVTEMAKAVNRNVDAVNLLREGDAEVTLEFEFMGRKFKSRLDWLDGDIIVDLKTTRNIGAYDFKRDMFNLGYHIQFAIYHHAIKEHTGKDPKFFVIAVDNSGEEMSEASVFRIGTDVLDKGYADLRQALRVLEECEKNDYWPSPNEGIHDLTLAEAKDWLGNRLV